MRLTIEYCMVCNYRPIAAAVSITVKKETGVETDLIEGGMGAFEVRLDGVLLFSKINYNRFPKADEIVRLVRATPGYEG